MYKQCKLKRNSTYQTVYLPIEFAVLNKLLKLKNNNVWDNGWKVIEVYHNSLTDEVTHVPKLIREHRKRTGDSSRRPVEDGLNSR